MIGHAKSRDQETIGYGNILRLGKDKGWNTVELVETNSPNSMNDDSRNTIDISKRTKSA